VTSRASAATLGALALVAATTLAYAPVLECGYVWDDDFHVWRNAALRSADGLRRIWLELGATPQYYPLVHTSFWLEWRLWGAAPAGYHATNVALHATAAVLAWRLLAALGVGAGAAWAAAALFALHPVHVESVAWISERKNVLMAVLYLASLSLWWRWRCAGDAPPRPSGRLAAAWLLYLAALASKTVACTWPAAALLLVFWKRGRVARRDLAVLAPFFAAGIAAGLVTVWMERSHVGAAGPEWALSAPERVQIAGRALWFYAGKLLWPAELSFIYPRWEVPAPASAWLYPAAAAAVLLGLLFARRRLGAGPFVAVAFFAGTLSPALGFFDVYPMRFSFVADHFQYLASLGLLALAAATVARAAGALGGAAPRAAAGLAALVLLALGALTSRQIASYRDEATLWRETLRRNPGAWIAHNNLGLLLFAQGDAASAALHYQRAVALNPRYEMAHYNLGILLAGQGRAGEALAHARRAVELAPRQADFRNQLGTLLAAEGRLDEAAASFEAALAIDPTMAKAHFNLGLAHERRGDLAAARRGYERALALRPRYTPARERLEALAAGRTTSPP